VSVQRDGLAGLDQNDAAVKAGLLHNGGDLLNAWLDPDYDTFERN